MSEQKVNNFKSYTSSALERLKKYNKKEQEKVAPEKNELLKLLIGQNLLGKSIETYEHVTMQYLQDEITKQLQGFGDGLHEYYKDVTPRIVKTFANESRLKDKEKQISHNIALWDIVDPNYKRLANIIAPDGQLLSGVTKQSIPLADLFLILNKHVYSDSKISANTFKEIAPKNLKKINRLKNRILKRERKTAKKGSISNRALQKLSIEQLSMLQSRFKSYIADSHKHQVDDNALLLEKFEAAIAVIKKNIEKKEAHLDTKKNRQVSKALRVLIGGQSKEWKKSHIHNTEYMTALRQNIIPYAVTAANNNEFTGDAKTNNKLSHTFGSKQKSKFDKIVKATDLDYINMIKDTKLSTTATPSKKPLGKPARLRFENNFDLEASLAACKSRLSSKQPEEKAPQAITKQDNQVPQDKLGRIAGESLLSPREQSQEDKSSEYTTSEQTKSKIARINSKSSINSRNSKKRSSISNARKRTSISL